MGLVQVLERLSERRSPLRIISATKRDLEQDLKEGRFREDLFFRLNVVDIRIPPLRERPEDILPLAQHLIVALSVDLGRVAPALSKDAAAMLLQHSWPANVRELKNVIERALLIWPGDILESEAFTEIRTANIHQRPRVGDDVTLHDLEREHILRILARLPAVKAAATLGVAETTVWRRRKLYEREHQAEVERSKAR
jgi:NtrC-family two-component system response regulator AlgB